MGIIKIEDYDTESPRDLLRLCNDFLMAFEKAMTESQVTYYTQSGITLGSIVPREAGIRHEQADTVVVWVRDPKSRTGARRPARAPSRWSWRLW
jgi:hypothetical protein